MPEHKNLQPRDKPEYEVPVVMPLGHLNKAEGADEGCGPGSGDVSYCDPGTGGEPLS
jgi:hypothetical protein